MFGAVMFGVVPAWAFMEVSVNNVVGEFLNNPIRAQQNYMNQEVYVEAEIFEITSGNNGEFLIRLWESRNFYFDCYLAKEALNTAANLSKRQKVKIRGTIYQFHQVQNGIFISGNIVSLRNCIIEHVLTQEEIEFNNLKYAAENGDIAAQNNLGVAYDSGRGVERNFEEAVKWYRIAAERGESTAKSNLGLKYLHGQGVEQNYEEALKWFRASAEHSNPLGMTNLGSMYYNGWGVEKNIDTAIEWYQKAADRNSEAFSKLKEIAENGNAKAQYRVGKMYENGKGVKQNIDEAIAWYKKAAEQNNAEAAYSLSGIYSSNKLSFFNVNEAAKYLKIAAQNGHQKAIKTIQDLKTALAEIKKIEQAAKKGDKSAQAKLKKMNTKKELVLLKQMGATLDGYTPTKVNSTESKFMINGMKVNVRTAPNTKSKVIKQLNAGHPVDVLERNGDWCRIRTASGTEGWVFGQYVQQK